MVRNSDSSGEKDVAVEVATVDVGLLGTVPLCAASSAKIGLVLYQYKAPAARPQRVADPFHVPLLLPDAVEAKRWALRDTAGCRMVRVNLADDRNEARYILCS